MLLALLSVDVASGEICSGYAATNCRSRADVRIDSIPALRPGERGWLAPPGPDIRKPAPFSLDELRREDLGLDREYRPDPGYVDRKVPDFRPVDRSIRPRTRF